METKSFFKHYDNHHKNKTNRILHFISTTILISCFIITFVFQLWWLIPIAIFQGYLIPHIGHKYFEKNKSMRNAHPVGCVIGSGRMYLKFFMNFFRVKN